MTSDTRIDRRQALILLGSLAALGLGACKRREDEDPIVHARRYLDAAKRLGKAWLDAGAQAPTAASVANHALAGRSIADLVGREDEARELLRARVREDFAKGRTARLQGWLLSRAELEVYAYVALHA